MHDRQKPLQGDLYGIFNVLAHLQGDPRGSHTENQQVSEIAVILKSLQIPGHREGMDGGSPVRQDR
jgi:hypothetical protein